MDTTQLIIQANRILNSNRTIGSIQAEALEFLRIYAGEKSTFYQRLSEVKSAADEDYKLNAVRNNLQAFISFIENGLLDGISIERKAQLDVVSDFLDQAQQLLENTKVHPAIPCALIGACLEEFLRTWIETNNISLEDSKPGLDAYARQLRDAEFISKQDMKDIVSWAGLRNHAAHGEWEDVSDRRRIALMLEGVNLFMRRYK